ncbi:MAG: DinB family protein, partial [Chitinophagaceae bacterium]
MINEIERIQTIRHSLLEFVSDLSTENFNEIPAGFNNNIIWNLAHLTAAQQGMCYLRAGLKPVINEEYITPFLPGKKPERFITEDEIKLLKDLFVSTLEPLKTDFGNNVFSGYPTWTTRVGVEMRNIEDVIKFLMFHDGLHSGYIMAM